MFNQSVANVIAVLAIGMSSAASADMLSATRPVIAMVADDLYTGEAVGHLNGAGTLTMRSQRNPALTCRGDFTSSAANGGAGAGRLQCSDGTEATFEFKRLTTFTGFGAGMSSHGPLRFAYGLDSAKAAPYLKLPAGKKLMHDGDQLALADL
jgi:hypothetical protein